MREGKYNATVIILHQLHAVVKCTLLARESHLWLKFNKHIVLAISFNFDIYIYIYIIYIYIFTYIYNLLLWLIMTKTIQPLLEKAYLVGIVLMLMLMLKRFRVPYIINYSKTPLQYKLQHILTRT